MDCFQGIVGAAIISIDPPLITDIRPRIVILMAQSSSAT